MLTFNYLPTLFSANNMNKNLLLIGAAAVAYALLRPKNTPLLASTGGGGTVATGAASYVPTTTTAPGWASTVSNVVGAAGTAVGVIKTGSSLWDDLRGALHIAPATAPATADVTADQSGGFWAGPKTQIS